MDGILGDGMAPNYCRESSLKAFAPKHVAAITQNVSAHGFTEPVHDELDPGRVRIESDHVLARDTDHGGIAQRILGSDKDELPVVSAPA